DAIEELRLVVAREIGLLGAEDDPDLERIGHAEPHAGVHDEVLARALGERDLVAAGAKDLEAGVDQRALDLRGVARAIRDGRFGHRAIAAGPRARKRTAKILRGRHERQDLWGQVLDFSGPCYRPGL